jgi:phosphoribosylaminoimidazole-succinocarboxamide synthase
MMSRTAQPLPEELPASAAKQRDRTILFEKQGKAYYQADLPNQLILSFLPPVSAGAKKRPKGGDLAALRNSIASHLFEYVEEYRISTHFVTKHAETEMTVKKTEGIPIVVHVHNIDGGEFRSRFGLTNGRGLEFPVLEHYYTAGETTTWVNEYHVYALGLATPEEFKQMNRVASKLNAVIRGLCDRRQLVLADMKLQFGRFQGQVILNDELSPYTCRFLDLSAADNADRFLPDRKDATSAFADLCDRLMLKI